MTRFLLFAIAFSSFLQLDAQTDPQITSWMINTTGITGRHYVEGNTTPIDDDFPANVQTVQYSTDNVYVNSSGVPAYITGHFGINPALTSNNEHIFQLPRNPVENTGTLTSTPLGSIAVLINGVPLFDFKDGQSYSLSDAADSGMGDGVWTRNAILAEQGGFDCAKGHPAPIMAGGGGPGGGGPGGGGPGGGGRNSVQLVDGTYHHHQNPTAFNMDKVVLSDICDTYLADGLYTIDESTHSPLIGYAFDGFPIYGPYAYTNTDGTGGISRIKSSYQERAITVRTHYADGSDVTDGPAISEAYPIGWYKEDFEYIANSGDLDEHNGRFAITPEYPNGTYAYYTTVDENWNSAFPYAIGPEYYGVVSGGNVNEISETVATYTAPTCESNRTISGTIASDTYQVSDTLFSDGQIAATETVTFQGTVVVLQAGFSVAAGAAFLAEISPCTASNFTTEETENPYTLINKNIPSVSENIFSNKDSENIKLTIFPNPASDLVIIQVNGILRQNMQVGLFDTNGQLLKEVRINQGSTIHHIDTRTLYNGTYFIKVFDGKSISTKKVIIQKD